MRLNLFGTLMLACLSACSGGGSGSGVAVPPVLPVAQSPGGIWFGFDSVGETVVFYVAETGELRTSMHTQGSLFASFGGGTVNVTANTVVNGSFELRGTLPLPPAQSSEDLSCSVSGSVLERQTLDVEIICSDSLGIVYDETVSLMYDGRIYERESSLAALAGNYTLEFMPDTNSLSIAGDGTISGMYHNGARCMVNGTATAIDMSYTLLHITWTMSACTDLFGVFEGTEMSGFALANPSPIGNPDSYYVLMVGQAQDGLFSISVLYDPT